MISSTATRTQRCVLNTVVTRSFFTKTSKMPQISLQEEFPSLPKISPSISTAIVTSSTTPSGLKIASSTTDGYISSLGLEIQAGTRIETPMNAGISQLFAHMAFRATELRSDLKMFRDIEAIGGKIYTSACRDIIRYNISVLPDKLSEAAEILAETTLLPKFALWDIKIQKNAVHTAAQVYTSDSMNQLIDAIYASAYYDDVSLGFPLYTTDNLASISVEELKNFASSYVNTTSAALVGSGIDHGTLTTIASSMFGDLPSTGQVPKAPSAKYIGGETRVKKIGTNKTYVALGFPTSTNSTGEAQVLQAAMNMKLKQALVGNKTIHTCLDVYQDTGLFVLTGAATSTGVSDLVHTFVKEMKSLATSPLSSEELAGAKAVASLSNVAAITGRQNELKALGSVAFEQGSSFPSPTKNVQGVTADAVKKLANEMIKARPSLASVGNVSAVPRLEVVMSALQ